jgi:ankyrin repeat protein
MNESQFFAAVEKCDVKRVGKYLEEDNTLVHARSPQGKTTLMIAVEKGSFDLFSLLMENGADINAAMYESNKTGTVLERTVDFGEEDMAALLIENGCNINHPETRQCYPLLTAAKAGLFDIVTKLLDAGGNVNTANADGTTVLMNLAVFGPRHRINPEPPLLIKQLSRVIEAGADVNTADGLNNSALTRAVFSGNRETVRFLIENGADPNHAAAMMPLSDLVRDAACLEILIAGGLNKSVYLDGIVAALLNVTFNSAKSMVKQLTGSARKFHEAGVALVEACRGADMTVFHRAVKKHKQSEVIGAYGVVALSVIMDSPVNRLEKVRTLIGAGATVNSPYRIKKPLMEAAEVKDGNIMRLLLDAGAKADGGAKEGEWTPLLIVTGAHRAMHDRAFPAKKFDPVIDTLMGMLLSAGADVNAQDSIGRTPLMYCLQLYPKNTDRLIEAGADVNNPAQFGWTPLMMADKENTKKLLYAGADVHAKDDHGRTALSHCKIPGKAKLLISAGASRAEQK